jgi:hypothetical protein
MASECNKVKSRITTVISFTQIALGTARGKFRAVEVVKNDITQNHDHMWHQPAHCDEREELRFCTSLTAVAGSQFARAVILPTDSLCG